MEHPLPLSFVLPNPTDLPGLALGFLDGNFENLRDLLNRASNLTSHLKHDSSHLNDRLLHLRTDLTKHAVSWITTSLAAKVSLDNLRLNLESLLSLCQLLTFQPSCLFGAEDYYYFFFSDLSPISFVAGGGTDALGEQTNRELHQLVEELCRIQNTRRYLSELCSDS